MTTRLAGIEPYTKPCHTLRKNCETDWLGNGPQVALAHYLRTEDALFDKAAGVNSNENVHKNVHNPQPESGNSPINKGLTELRP